MTLFDEVIARLGVWLERLDRERDFASQVIAREGHKPHLAAWMDTLQTERAKHVALISHLEVLLKDHPALLLASRPTHTKGMLKAGLRAVPALKKQA